MSLKRKAMVLAMLVGILSLAVYLSGNYQENPSLDATEAVETGRQLGQAQQVDGQSDEAVETMQEDSYFDQARLTRQQTRDEALELLREVTENDAGDENTIQQALLQMEVIADNIQTEGKMENLLRAKGFTDCLVYVGEGEVNVLVESDGLDDTQTAQIRDVVLESTSVSADQIKIVDVKS
ncbi:MAG: SpoIIIAH-like family protein [Eubacteriales bacterium]